MLLLTLLLPVAILSNLVNCNNDKIFVNGNSPVVDQSNRSPRDSTDAVMLIKPASRAYKCFLKLNTNCEMFRFNNSFKSIIKARDFPSRKVSDESNLLYDELHQRPADRQNSSHLKIEKYNETHFVTEIMWVVRDKTLELDTIKVFLSDSNFTDGQLMREPVLNLACSYRKSNSTRIQSNIVRFYCYIRDELIKDLLHGAQDARVLASMVKIVGKNDAFYQIADISLRESINAITPFHGFVSYPPSRAKLCQLRVNKNCGQVTYEPQSVEGRKGFPYAKNSPPDGKIASGNNSNYDQLNEYGSNRWVRVQFPELKYYNKTHVYFNLTWYFTAPHSSENIRVYISNENYTSTEPLSRRHLDLNPVCSKEFHGQYPPLQLTMSCLMTLQKYRQLSQLKELLLLSVWNINDTAFAFYQVMDLESIPNIPSFRRV